MRDNGSTALIEANITGLRAQMIQSRNGRFWCSAHQETCLTSSISRRVLCEHGGHVVCEDYAKDAWEYCCSCETFIELGKHDALRTQCLACERDVTARYQCDQCELMVFDTVDPPRKRGIALSPEGLLTTACPGCLSEPRSSVIAHVCSVLRGAFNTSRNVCLFCDDQLSLPPVDRMVPPQGNSIEVVGAPAAGGIAKPSVKATPAYSRLDASFTRPLAEGANLQGVAAARGSRAALIVAMLALLAVTVVAWTLVRRGSGQNSAKEAAKAQTLEESVGEGDILKFIERWRLAWERADIGSYSRCYAPDFTGRLFSANGGTRVLTRAEWMDDKARKFSGQAAFEVRLTDIAINTHVDGQRGGGVMVSMKQRYRSSKYSDVGRKSLRLKVSSEGIFIQSEDFSPLSR